jgi:hypothetical protein
MRVIGGYILTRLPRRTLLIRHKGALIYNLVGLTLIVYMVQQVLTIAGTH